MSKRRWILLFLMLFAASWIAGAFVLPFAVNSTRLRRSLTGRLESAFGRKVEVERFDISLLGPPRLDAGKITIAEDPRFGAEHFLRAEHATIGLRWQALLLGRFEFGTVTLTRPSVNLVRNAEGAWNFSTWVERNAQSREAENVAARPGSWLPRIAVEGGRINFKQGSDKKEFALGDVTGNIAKLPGGKWSLNLEARPMRAGIVLQEAGKFGVVGVLEKQGLPGAADRGASKFRARWTDASISDVLRLMKGTDYGIRGRLQGEATVTVPQTTPEESSEWAISGKVLLTGMHRWNLPPRLTDPGLNCTVEGKWWPAETRAEIMQGLIEGPHSSIRIAGEANWNGHASAGSAIRIASSGIDLTDLLDWHRSFRPGVADSLTVEGNAGVDMQFSGWPPRPEKGALVTDGGRIHPGGTSSAWQIGKTIFQIEKGKLQLQPTSIQFIKATAETESAAVIENKLILSGEMEVGLAPKWSANLIGQTSRSEVLFASLGELGLHPIGGWTASGAATARLKWEGQGFPLHGAATGILEFKNAEVQSPFLNFPAKSVNAKIDIKKGERRVTLTSAEAFGAKWKGTMTSKSPGAAWVFDLVTDRLDTSELVHWMNPDAGETRGLLAQVLPGAPKTWSDEALTARAAIQGQGKLRVDELRVGALSLRKWIGEIVFSGAAPWKVEVPSATADFYGGNIRAGFWATASSEAFETSSGRPAPKLRVDASYSKVNLSALITSFPRLAGRFNGVAEGKLKLETAGFDRTDWLRNFSGDGFMHSKNAEWLDIDVIKSFESGSVVVGPGQPHETSARFHVVRNRVFLDSVVVVKKGEDLLLEGSIDSSLELELLRRVISDTTAKANGKETKPTQFEGLKGSLTSPKWAGFTQVIVP